MDMGLHGARVVVTAGAAGIGRAVVEAFLAEGARVAACDVDADALARLPPDVPAHRCDVASEAEVGRFVGDAARALGGIDALVCNAGVAGPTAGVGEVDLAAWERTLAVCLTGQFLCVRAALPHLRASANASIACMASAAGRMGFPRRAPYAAAKWGVVGLARSLAAELGPDGIRCNAILPGLVSGDRQRRVLEARAQATGRPLREVEVEALSRVSMGLFVAPEEIAAQIVLLASPRGRTTSGQAIGIDGDLGMLA